WKADNRSISSVKSVNQYTPAWEIIVHEGFVNNYTKKNEILQVNMKDLYYTTAENADSLNQEFNFILLEINEENSISQKENYEIELYEVTDLD
ncbi:hypothetical protein, partial [Escherichia coli]|uniref:hypothetical protein n=1 Tax=Escherichia coli TaxID=562 RepID=UPI00200CD3B1